MYVNVIQCVYLCVYVLDPPPKSTNIFWLIAHGKIRIDRPTNMTNQPTQIHQHILT